MPQCSDAVILPDPAPAPEVIAKMLAHLQKAAPDQHQAELPLGARAPPTPVRLI